MWNQITGDNWGLGAVPQCGPGAKSLVRKTEPSEADNILLIEFNCRILHDHYLPTVILILLVYHHPLTLSL